MIRTFLYFLFLTASLAATAQAKLSAIEQKIISQVNKNIPRSLKLMEDMVNINSGTLNVEGVRKTGAILRQQFDSLGFVTEWVELPDSLKRAGHLVASIKGNRGRKVFLIGHLDTVFEPDSSFRPYRLLDDSTGAAVGDYIWIAESDDWGESNFFETVMAGLKEEKDCVLGYCQSYSITNSQQIDWISTSGSIVETLPEKHFIAYHMLENTEVSTPVWPYGGSQHIMDLMMNTQNLHIAAIGYSG